MTEINRQKFIAELSKLLTFMYEEDQKFVIAMYNSLFNDADDEQALISFLASPTRQAVMLARAYNAKERKLQVHSTSRADSNLEDDGEDMPVFIQALDSLRRQAEDRGIVGEKGFESALSVRGQSEAEESLAPVPEETAAEVKVAEPESAAADGNGKAEPAAESEPEVPAEGEPVAEPVTAAEPESTEAAAVVSPVFKAPEAPPAELEFDFTDGQHPLIDSDEDKPQTKTVIIIPLAVIYGIFAFPITLAICVVLLAPTFLSLGLSVGCVFAGFKVLLAAFGGFFLFADMMVVLGCGLIILALGLLFLWIFVWFVGAVIAGVINGAISLGGKWCSKEVPVK